MMQGIDPATIPYTIDPVPHEFREEPHRLVVDIEAKIRRVAFDVIEEHWGRGHDEPDAFRWSESWHHLDYDDLWRAFSAQELYRLWVGSFLESRLSRHVEEHEPLLWKVSNSLWQYGSVRDINTLSAHVEGLKRLHVNLPGFDLRITHSRSINTHGTAEHVEPYLYLDASFGVLLYYRGEHVLTCGFALSKEGVLVAQVQLRQKKGNRWLYKLPAHYVDFMLDVIGDAFGRDRVWLVDGKSAVEAVHKSYAKAEDCKLDAVGDARVAALYDRSLTSFVRTGETVHRQRRTYIRLVARLDLVMEAA